MGVFHVFLNCTHGTKSRSAPQTVAQRGDPISDYIFILRLEILLILIKNDPDMKGIEIFEYC